MDLKDFKKLSDQNDGVKYAMTVVCHFSGYPRVFLQKTKKAETVKSNLQELFSEFGTPEIVHMDNGGEFIGHEVVEFLDGLQVKILHGKPRNPKEQGKDLFNSIKSTNNNRKSRKIQWNSWRKVRKNDG